MRPVNRREHEVRRQEILDELLPDPRRPHQEKIAARRKQARTDEAYQAFLDATRRSNNEQEEFDVITNQYGLGGAEIQELAERLKGHGFEVEASRRWKLAQSNYVECAKMIESVDKIIAQAQGLMEMSGSEALQTVIEQAGQMKETLVACLTDMTQLDSANKAFDQTKPQQLGQPPMPTTGKPVMPTARRLAGRASDVQQMAEQLANMVMQANGQWLALENTMESLDADAEVFNDAVDYGVQQGWFEEWEQGGEFGIGLKDTTGTTGARKRGGFRPFERKAGAAHYVRDDSWGRAVYQGDDGESYVEVDGVAHSMTDEGEPLAPAEDVRLLDSPGDSNDTSHQAKMAFHSGADPDPTNKKNVPEMTGDPEWEKGFEEGKADAESGTGYQGLATADLMQGSKGGVEIETIAFEAGYWHGYVDNVEVPGFDVGSSRRKLAQGRKTVEWDDNDIQSIEQAEREKAKLEDSGYNLLDTVQLGLSKWRLIYQKEGARRKIAQSNEEIAQEWKDFLASDRGSAIGSPEAGLQLFLRYNYPDKQGEFDAILETFQNLPSTGGDDFRPSPEMLDQLGPAAYGSMQRVAQDWQTPDDVKVGNQVHFLDKNGTDRFGKVVGIDNEGTYKVQDDRGRDWETDYIMNKMSRRTKKAQDQTQALALQIRRMLSEQQAGPDDSRAMTADDIFDFYQLNENEDDIEAALQWGQYQGYWAIEDMGEGGMSVVLKEGAKKTAAVTEDELNEYTNANIWGNLTYIAQDGEEWTEVAMPRGRRSGAEYHFTPKRGMSEIFVTMDKIISFEPIGPSPLEGAKKASIEDLDREFNELSRQLEQMESDGLQGGPGTEYFDLLLKVKEKSKQRLKELGIGYRGLEGAKKGANRPFVRRAWDMVEQDEESQGSGGWNGKVFLDGKHVGWIKTEEGGAATVSDVSGEPLVEQVFEGVEEAFAWFKSNYREAGKKRAYRGRSSYKGDPHWIDLRYPAVCRNCGKQMRRDDRAFYYPSDKSMFCDAEGCGQNASRDFHDMAEAEEMLGGGAEFQQELMNEPDYY
jgi:hypothetical protein